MSETTKTIAEWQNETFGPATTTQERVRSSWNKISASFNKAYSCDKSQHRPNLSRAVRAVEEMAELIETLVMNDDDPKACAEVADIQIVLAGIPAVHGKEQQDLVDAKMAINRARQWNVTGDGHGQHK